MMVSLTGNPFASSSFVRFGFRLCCSIITGSGASSSAQASASLNSDSCKN